LAIQLQTILFALKCLKNAYQSLPERLPEPTNSAEEAIFRRLRRTTTSGLPAE